MNSKANLDGGRGQANVQQEKRRRRWSDLFPKWQGLGSEWAEQLVRSVSTMVEGSKGPVFSRRPLLAEGLEDRRLLAVDTFTTSDSQFDTGVDNQGYFNQNGVAVPDNNDTLLIGRASNLNRAGFATFDLSGAVPAGGALVGASLQVSNVSRVGSLSSTVWLNPIDNFTAAELNAGLSGTSYFVDAVQDFYPNGSGAIGSVSLLGFVDLWRAGWGH